MTQCATPTELSLSQAAKATGKSKSTIHRSIKNGKLSATRHEDGSYSIAASELFRAFPIGTDKGSEWTRPEPSGTTDETAIVRIKALEDALERERELNADLKADRDSWRHQATALLTAPPAKKPWWRIWR